MVYFLGIVGALWWLLSLAALLNVRAARRLPALAEFPAQGQAPHVSVIIAGRDEEARIEQTVRGLLQQQAVELEIVVVDDRSRDRTGEILDRLATEDPRLRVIHVQELPAGWLGKCHACARGAEHATGEWLLFTDADIHMRPDLVARAIATARAEAADHLTLWPGLNCTGILTRAAVTASGQTLSLYCRPAQINRDRGKKGMGVGAFNLIRAAAYRAIGGHEPLKLELIDDVKLGLLVRRAGFRQRVYSGCKDLEADWAHSILEMIKLLEKNWFAGVEFSVVKGIAVMTSVLVLWFAAILGPWLHPWAGTFALAGLWSTSVAGYIQLRDMGWPGAIAPLVPFGFLTFVAAGVHSIWKALRQGGVRWRDTFYSLRELRAGLVR